MTDEPTALATLVKHLDGAGDNSAANMRFLWRAVSDLAQATLAEVERIDKSAGASWRAHKNLDERFALAFERLAELERRMTEQIENPLLVVEPDPSVIELTDGLGGKRTMKVGSFPACNTAEGDGDG